ncbi:MAG TPA: CpaD family pilus assembly lipoprotein [Novosphingobium sp.]|nr:CpaD family pilus assembly lipoprotein [Novosphingobium sp.]
MTLFATRARRPYAAALTLSLGLALSACGGIPTNRGLESLKQPVVTRSNYTLDVASGPGGLSVAEERRLAGWFEAMDLRYGDRVAVDDPYASVATRDAVAAVAARHGLLVSENAPVTAGTIPPGSVRVVVSRSSASVPGCPDWSAKSDFNMGNGSYPNYGCAVNSNLASMVADPEHLLHGEKGTGETVVLTSSKAIDSYRSAAPTGEKGLKQVASDGGKGK